MLNSNLEKRFINELHGILNQICVASNTIVDIREDILDQSFYDSIYGRFDEEEQEVPYGFQEMYEETTGILTPLLNKLNELVTELNTLPDKYKFEGIFKFTK